MLRRVKHQLNKINRNLEHKFRSWENKGCLFQGYISIIQTVVFIAFGILLTIVFVTIIRGIYLLFRGTVVWAEWTGYGGKTLWDWQDLLIIPVIVILLAFWLDQSNSIKAQKIETDRQREEALRRFFDDMSNLLIEKDLQLTKYPEDGVRIVARTRTLTTLRVLDPFRKGLLLRFLHETGVITRGNHPLDLSNADFRKADLRWANLSNACLKDVDLSYSNLASADLSGADLNGSNLEGAYLNGVDLNSALLQKAKINNASLEWAHLDGADLTGTTVKNSKLRSASFRKAYLWTDITSDPYSDHNDIRDTDFSEAVVKYE